MRIIWARIAFSLFFERCTFWTYCTTVSLNTIYHTSWTYLTCKCSFIPIIGKITWLTTNTIKIRITLGTLTIYITKRINHNNLANSTRLTISSNWIEKIIFWTCLTLSNFSKWSIYWASNTSLNCRIKNAIRTTDLALASRNIILLILWAFRAKIIS
jgi:hypothetical protein